MGLDVNQKAIAKGIFLRLTEFGEGSQDTRRRALLDELIPSGEDANSVESVLQLLETARLVTASHAGLETASDRGETDEEAVMSPAETIYVDVSHEALIREWGTLREWLSGNRDGLRVHRHLTESAQEWARLARDPRELYGGVRLDQALEWSEEHAGELNDLEDKFLQASKADRQRKLDEEARIEEERKEAQRRAVVAAQALAAEEAQRAKTEAELREAEAKRASQAQELAEEQRLRADDQQEAAQGMAKRARIAIVVGVVAILLAVLAGWFGVESGRNADIAAAREAEAAQEKDNAIAAQETAEANERRAIAETLVVQAQNRIQKLGHVDDVATILARDAVEVTNVGENPYTTASALQLFREIKKERAPVLQLPRHRHSGRVWSVAWSPDGAQGAPRLATASSDGTAKVWTSPHKMIEVLDSLIVRNASVLLASDGAYGFE